MADEAYIDVMESVCTMIDHAMSFHLQARAPNLSYSRYGTSSTLQVQDTVPSFGSFPGDIDIIHRYLTALPMLDKMRTLFANCQSTIYITFQQPTWSTGAGQPSQHFKSFGPISLPAKRNPASLNSLSPVASFEVGNEQNISHSPQSTPLVFPVETHQGVSNITDSHSEDTNLRQRNESMNQRRLIPKWLSPLNHEEMHNFNLSQRYQQTGIWLSTAPSFRHWRDSSQSSIFWLCGARMFLYPLAHMGR